MTKVRIDPKREFKKVERMLYDLAWGATCPPSLTFEEARSEAFVAYMKACQTYDPTRGMEFSSWVYYKAEKHLKSVLSATGKRTRRTVCYDPSSRTFWNLIEKSGPRPSGKVRQIFDELSSDAKELLQLLLETPAEIATEEVCWDGFKPVSPKKLLDRVREEIGFQLGLDDFATKMLVLEIEEKWAAC